MAGNALTGDAWLATHPNNGRPKGSVNERTRAVRDFCRLVLEDPEYRRRLRQRLIAGTLGPMEQVLWVYAYGKPKEQAQLEAEEPRTRTEQIEQMSHEERQRRMLELKLRLLELDQKKQVLDALTSTASPDGVDDVEAAAEASGLPAEVIDAEWRQMEAEIVAEEEVRAREDRERAREEAILRAAKARKLA